MPEWLESNSSDTSIELLFNSVISSEIISKISFLTSKLLLDIICVDNSSEIKL